ncbi:MAG: aldose 1-epimerase [Cytophagaceae bacterium]|nr:aldose 1-epimerase [Cytophagaceae bacterium]MDW8456587.1 aldose 1-epimerase [Cytophagaceae bacterium]
MFDFASHKWGRYTLTEIFNKDSGESISFFPDYGACLNQLILKGKNGENHPLFSAHDNYESLITKGNQMFKGVKLFPYPNRVNMGTYKIYDRTYKLPINFPIEGHAIHGLVMESCFETISTKMTPQFGSITIGYAYDKEHEGYPFKYNLEITFTLRKHEFVCETIVKNTDTQSIPIGDGWHPYFTTGNKIDELYISIPVEMEYETNELKIPTGVTKKNPDLVHLTKLENKKFDTCFKLKEGNPLSVIKLFDPTLDQFIYIWMQSGNQKYSYVQIYTPSSRDCIAIEPMTCIPDAFNNKEGLIILEPAESRNFVWGISTINPELS